jgi:hypothetical protein
MSVLTTDHPAVEAVGTVDDVVATAAVVELVATGLVVVDATARGPREGELQAASSNIEPVIAATAHRRPAGRRRPAGGGATGPA